MRRSASDARRVQGERGVNLGASTSSDQAAVSVVRRLSPQVRAIWGDGERRLA
jgi:hypothetical protein